MSDATADAHAAAMPAAGNNITGTVEMPAIEPANLTTCPSLQEHVSALTELLFPEEDGVSPTVNIDVSV